jgi:hypothetical protein
MTTRHSTVGWWLCVLCGMAALTGCAGAPRARPIPTSPVEDTITAARKRLEGRWALESLQVMSLDGRKADIDATGVLTSDEFGGLRIQYKLSDAGQREMKGLGIVSPNPEVSTAGRVVIDVQNQRITYMGEDAGKQALGFDADVAARRAHPFAIERVRHYTFEADGILRLSTRYDSGREASVSRWKKVS